MTDNNDTDYPGWQSITIINNPTSEYGDYDEKQEKVTQGNISGYECVGCYDFFPQAELNWPENYTRPLQFKCYVCRKGINQK